MSSPFQVRSVGTALADFVFARHAIAQGWALQGFSGRAQVSIAALGATRGTLSRGRVGDPHMAPPLMCRANTEISSEGRGVLPARTSSAASRCSAAASIQELPTPRKGERGDSYPPCVLFFAAASLATRAIAAAAEASLRHLATVSL